MKQEDIELLAAIYGKGLIEGESWCFIAMSEGRAMVVPIKTDYTRLQ